MYLEDMPLDIGYASEKVLINDISGKEDSIGGHTGKTQLIITTPSIDEKFLNEIQKISEIIPKSDEHEIITSLVVANDSHEVIKSEKFNFYIDSYEEFADMYGVRLKGKPFHGELTKAIILISKDGAIYYDQFCDDLSHEFNIDILYRKILAAQLCYTGKGCH
jgi:peroxiredoxin